MPIILINIRVHHCIVSCNAAVCFSLNEFDRIEKALSAALDEGCNSNVHQHALDQVGSSASCLFHHSHGLQFNWLPHLLYSKIFCLLF